MDEFNEDEIKCSLCQNILSDPKTLSCFHNFCSKCIQLYSNLSGFQNNTLCPQCDQETAITSEGFSKLKCVPFVLKLLESYTDKKCSASEPHFSDEDNAGKNFNLRCELCELFKSSKFCTSCEQYICGKCSEMHKKLSTTKFHELEDILPTNESVNCEMCDHVSTKYCYDCKQHMCRDCIERHGRISAAKSHRVVKNEEKNEEFRKLIYCREHPMKCLQFYCGSCKHLICEHCTTRNHHGHQILIEGKQPTDEKQEETKQRNKQTDDSEISDKMTDRPSSDEIQEVSTSTLNRECHIKLEDYKSCLLERASLGRDVKIGQLYNIHKNEFLKGSVFNAEPQNKDFKVDEIPTKKLTKFVPQSLQSCYNAVGLSSWEKLQVLLEISKPQGHAEFLNFCQSHPDESRAQSVGLMMKMRTKEEKLEKISEGLIPENFIEQMKICDSPATHFVVGIEWGAISVIIMNENGNEKEAKIDEVVTQLADSIQNRESISWDTDCFNKNYEIQLFTDNLPAMYSHTDHNMDKIKTCQKMDVILSSKNNGQGWPLKYFLLPIHVLSQTNNQSSDSLPEEKRNANNDTCEAVVLYFEDLGESCKEIANIQQLIKKNQICLSKNLEKWAEDFMVKINIFADSTKKKLAIAIIKDSNVDTDPTIKTIMEEIQKGIFCSHEIEKQCTEQKSEIFRKVNFFKELEKLNVIYVGRGMSVQEVRKVRNMKTYYALFFDPLNDDYEFCKNNFIEIATNMASSTPEYHTFQSETSAPCNRIFCLAVDLEVSKPVALEEGVPSGNCICFYHEGVYQSSKIAEDVETNKKQNWVISDDMICMKDAIMDRIIVEMSCPCRRHFEEEENIRMRWLCLRCRGTIQCNNVKTHFFCYCGMAKISTYKFKCGNAEHGDNFIFYDPSIIEHCLKGLEPVKCINILILGETGVGKSTWINGIVNYLTFETLEEAVKSEKILALVPSSFSMTDSSMKLKWIKAGSELGKSENEVESNKGESATQGPVTYKFQLGDLNVRLIDTPGIGDSRGIEKDKENFDAIVRHLRGYDTLHGICILLKPNNSRLTVLFRFCISELLTHLHRDAAKNIIFCFTNARSTFYRPGDTLPPLQGMLDKYKNEQGVNIETSENTIYCMDNEPFRFLCALKHNEVFGDDEKENFAKSWEKSRSETNRMFEFIKGLKPHSMVETLSLNDARDIILGLMQPMTEISKTITANISILEERKLEISRIDEKDKDLKEKLELPTIDVIAVQLGYPMTVCTSPRCTQTVRVGNTSVCQTLYVTECHSQCYLKGIQPEIFPNPQLQQCAAMGGTSNCTHCGCRWDVHMHITYQMQQQLSTTIDNTIQQLIEQGASNKELLQAAIVQAECHIAVLKKDREKLTKISAKFGSFLKTNAIVPYNDAFDEYIQFRIKEERAHVAGGGLDGNLVSLLNLRDVYLEQVNVLKSVMTDKHSNLTPADIYRLRNELYAMKGNGATMKMVAQIVAKSNVAMSEAQEVNYHSRPHHSGSASLLLHTLPVRFLKFVGVLPRGQTNSKIFDKHWKP